MAKNPTNRNYRPTKAYRTYEVALTAVQYSYGAIPSQNQTSHLVRSRVNRTSPCRTLCVRFTNPIPLLGTTGRDPRVREVEGTPATTAAVAGVRAESRRRVTVQALTRRVLTLSLLSVDGTDSLRLFFFFFPPLKIKKRFMSWSRASKNE